MLTLLPFHVQAGLSMALGAFISGLLMAETEFALQVESDISPYKGLLLGLFFQTVRGLSRLCSNSHVPDLVDVRIQMCPNGGTHP
jgi:hypothetical protein